MTAQRNQRDAAAVSKLYRDWIEAWNRRDAEGMARLTAAGGTIVGFDGSRMTGPDEVEATLTAIFAHHQTKPYVAIIRDIRPLGPDAMLLRADCGMLGSDPTAVNPVVNAIQSLVAVLHDGEWKIELFQNTPAAFHGRPELVEAFTADLNRALNA